MNKLTSVDIIRKLAATPKKNEKKQILTDAWMNGCIEFFKGAQLAYDSQVTFGVAKVAEILEDDGVIGTFTFDDFLQLADKLAKRELTGHAARDAINDAAMKTTVSVWNEFYRRILLKDLRIGCDLTTINKVLEKLQLFDPAVEDYFIFDYTPMLAFPAKDHPKHMKGWKYIDTKINGYRFTAFCDKVNNTVKIYTRTGNETLSIPHINNAILSLMTEINFSFALDGEITGIPFQQIATLLSKGAPDSEVMKFAVFDIVPCTDPTLKGFSKTILKKTLHERHEFLVALQESGLINKHCGNSVYVIPKILVNLDTTEGQKSYNDFNKQALADGAEGIMIKSIDAYYVCDRSVDILKAKPQITISLEIVGFYPGTGKNSDRLGGINCEGYDAEYGSKFFKVDCGGGFSDELRLEIWNNKEKYMGFIVELSADMITQDSKNKDIWSLRHPNFIAMRGNRPGEKL